LGTSTGRELRLVVGGQPLDDPTRLVLVGKQTGDSTKDVLQRSPKPPAAIEMKDVRQLVHDDKPPPTVVVLQPGIGDGRNGKNRDAIGGIGRGESVGAVHVVR